MSARWLVASAVLLAALVPCGVAALRGTARERLVGFEMATVVETMLLATLSEALHVGAFLDLALALALLAFGGGLVFARYLERWA